MPNLSSLIKQSARTLRLDRGARFVYDRSPVVVQDRARKLVRRMRVRAGYRAKLVPEEELRDSFRAAVNLLLELQGPDDIGDYLEFGVCHGTSLLCMHMVLEEAGLTSPRLVGFDSFEGLPENAEDDDEGLWKPGQFESDYQLTRRVLTRKGIDWDRTFLVKGWFSDTLNDELIRSHKLERASLIMIDSDMYSSAMEALTFCAPLIVDRAIIFHDDWGAFAGRLAERRLGERRAFEEFLAANPHLTATELPQCQYARAKVFLVEREG